MTAAAKPKPTLYSALAAVQAGIESITKGNEVKGSGFSYRYADLNAVWESIRPLLAEHGLFVHQAVHGEPGDRRLVTRIYNAAGDHIEDGGIPLIINKNDMQGLGGAITYARRYGILNSLGIATTDDDGASAGLEDKPKNSMQDPAWRGPLAKTALTAMAREIGSDIRGCSDIDELIALQNAPDTIKVTGQLAIDLPRWWDHEPPADENERYEHNSFYGLSQQFANRADEIRAEQEAA